MLTLTICASMIAITLNKWKLNITHLFQQKIETIKDYNMRYIMAHQENVEGSEQFAIQTKQQMEQTFVGVYHLPVTAGELREMKCYFNPQKLNYFIHFM